MRSRNLKPGFFKNEGLGDLGPYAQLLFEGLWCLADRDGKLEDRPSRIKAEIFPYYEPSPSVDELLNSLFNSPERFIERYTVDGVKYIKIWNFLSHQSPHNRESESKIPNPGSAEPKKGHALSKKGHAEPGKESKGKEKRNIRIQYKEGGVGKQQTLIDSGKFTLPVMEERLGKKSASSFSRRFLLKKFHLF